MIKQMKKQRSVHKSQCLIWNGCVKILIGYHLLNDVGVH